MQKNLSDSSQIRIWEGPKGLILTPFFGKNIIDFNVDTIQLLAKEHYELTFNVLGISDSITVPLVTFGIGFPDSVFIKRKTVTDNGLFTISLPPASSITNDHPTRLFGSIYLPPRKGNTKIVIYNIGIYTKKEEEKASTTSPRNRIESLEKIELSNR
jgi:hypothetical protein